MRLETRGAAQLRQLSRRMHTAAQDLPAEIAAAARRAMGPLPSKLKGSALSVLPAKGGLNRDVAFRGTFRVYRIPSGARLVAQHEYDIVGMNYGVVYHPLFGDMGHWYRQVIAEGWWDRVIDNVEPAARQEMDKALTNTRRKIER